MTELHKKTVSRLMPMDDYDSKLAKTNLSELLELCERTNFGVNLFSERTFRFEVINFLFFNALNDKGLHLVCRYDNITKYYLACKAFDEYVVLVSDSDVKLGRTDEYLDARSVSKEPDLDALKYQRLATLGDQEIHLNYYGIARVILSSSKSRSRLRYLDPLLYSEDLVFFMSLRKYAPNEVHDEDIYHLIQLIQNEKFFDIYVYRDHILFDLSDQFYLEFAGDFFRLLSKRDVRSIVTTDFNLERSKFVSALRNSIRKEFLDSHDTFLI